MGLIQSLFPACPDCGENDDVTENRLFSIHNPNKYFCERCRTFFND